MSFSLANNNMSRLMLPADKCNSYPASFCSDGVHYVTPGGRETIKYICKTYLKCGVKLSIEFMVQMYTDIRVGRQSNRNTSRLKTLTDARSAAIGWAATIILLLRITNKINKENLKPRKGEHQVMKVLQCNMQKSQHA